MFVDWRNQKFYSIECGRYLIAFDLMNVRVRIDVIYQEKVSTFLGANVLNQLSITKSNEYNFSDKKKIPKKNAIMQIFQLIQA